MSSLAEAQLGAASLARPAANRLAAAAEVLAVFAACQLFLWVYSRQFRRGWVLILAFILASIAVRRETPARLGLTWRHARGAGRWMAAVLPVATLPLAWFGFSGGRLALLLPDSLALQQFGLYLAWCVLQQFALQSYMHNRLLDAVPRPAFTVPVVGLIFGSLHLPNPVLTIATLAGGALTALVFVRYRNIWILALGQALISTVIFVSLPDAWHHRLRVGPGFFWWPGR